jgi:ferritin-like metal-binding protein YciE
MNLEHPDDLLHDQLRDLYSAESQVILTLPELARQARHPALRRLLVDHEKQSLEQKERLQRVAGRHDIDPSGDLCKAMQGLIEGGNEHLGKVEDPLVKDLLLIAHCNRIKHYEIAGYGFILSLAECLGRREDAEDFALTLDQEKDFVAGLAKQGNALFGLPLAAS